MNYYKDNIINNNNTIVNKNVKCKLFHLLMETYQMVNITLWKLLNCLQCLKFENHVELKDTLIYLINQVSNLFERCVQKVDNAIHWINLYPLDCTIGFPLKINTYPLDSDLSSG